MMSIRYMVMAGLFAALMAVSSQIYIPIGPVPHTLQIFFVLLAGIVLGSRWGFTSVAVWIMLGIFGLPVFAQGKAGAAVLVGPTGGFLVGFALCAYLVGLFTQGRNLTYFNLAAAMLLGLIVVYAVGLAGFMASFKYFLNKPMTVDKAVMISVAPFMPFDLIKGAAAVYIGLKVRRALSRAGLVSGE